MFLLTTIALMFHSCGIFKTHHKDKLLDFENILISKKSLKLNGYYYTEFEFEYGDNSQSFIDEYIKNTGIHKVKYLSVFFIYEDGFVIKISSIDGLSHYYCAEKTTYENSYESAHKTIELMLNAQNSTDKRTKRICGFSPKDISNKGLAKIKNNDIKIQFYNIEMQNPAKDSFNSAYLYELNGIIESDSSFVIKSEIEFRTNKITSENSTFKFRKTDQKPNIENYFKKNIKRKD